MFCADYHGPYLVDGYAGFVEMLRQWPIPWRVADESALNDLTAAQFFLARAWEINNAAKYFLEGEAVAQGWEPEEAMNYGVVAAVSAAKLLSHAKFLIVLGRDKMGLELA
jgi:hypothetical protein